MYVCLCTCVRVCMCACVYVRVCVCWYVSNMIRIGHIKWIKWKKVPCVMCDMKMPLKSKE